LIALLWGLLLEAADWGFSKVEHCLPMMLPAEVLAEIPLVSILALAVILLALGDLLGVRLREWFRRYLKNALLRRRLLCLINSGRFANGQFAT